jgi:hypothetical protein
VHDVVVEEGAEGEGDDGAACVREGKGVPGTVAERRSHFQNEAKRKEWEFEVGRVYWADFGNQYLDFNGTCLSFSPYCLRLYLRGLGWFANNGV